ncbi:MAG: hypothetical protein ACRETW_14395 [Stenotrophobium sp.]
MSSRPGPTGPVSAANFSGRAESRGVKRTFLAGAALGLMAALAGCGNSNTTTVMFSAFAELGQPNFNTPTANGGSNTVSGTGLSGPVGSVATNGTLFYVVDSNNSRILGWTTPPTTPSTPPNFVLGQLGLTTRAAGSTSSQLAFPSSVSIATNPTTSAVQLVVADTGNNRVLIWNTLPTTTAQPADVVIGQAGFGTSKANGGGAAPSSTVLSSPTNAQIANGQLFVADQGNDRVLIWNAVPTASSTAANIVLGQPDMVSDQAQCIGTLPPNVTVATCPSQINSFTNANYQLHNPNGLWTDGFAHLLVADTGNNRVMSWNGIPTSNGAAATNVVGQITFNTSTGTNGASGLRGPTGVGSGAAGFYVADQGNNRVLFYSTFPTSNGLAATSVFGQSDFTHTVADDDDQNGVSDTTTNAAGGSVLVPTARTLNAPSGVSVYNGTVYITDQANNRIMLFSGQ